MTWSRLAPAGGFSSPAMLGRELARLARTGAARVTVIEELRDACGATCLVPTLSGKDALIRTFSTLKRLRGRSRVVVAGLSCPDLVTSAWAAGVEVCSADINAETLDFDWEQLPAAIKGDELAIVLSNLFGMADSYADASRLAYGSNAIVVDDACQAARGTRGGRHVGSEPGAVGILSFGRGKAFCGIGGGAILVNKDAGFPVDEFVAEASNTPPYPEGREPVSGAGFAGQVRECLMACATWALETPILYGVLDRAPGTGLGDVKVIADPDQGPPSLTQLIVARSQLKLWESQSERASFAVKTWCDALEDFPVVLPSARRGEATGAALLRFPVILPRAEDKRQLLRELRMSGAGASASYGRSLSEFPEFSGRLSGPGTPVAAKTAARLITLPVHGYVTIGAIERAVRVFKKFYAREV